MISQASTCSDLPWLARTITTPPVRVARHIAPRRASPAACLFTLLTVVPPGEVPLLRAFITQGRGAWATKSDFWPSERQRNYIFINVLPTLVCFPCTSAKIEYNSRKGTRTAQSLNRGCRRSSPYHTVCPCPCIWTSASGILRPSHIEPCEGCPRASVRGAKCHGRERIQPPAREIPSRGPTPRPYHSITSDA